MIDRGVQIVLVALAVLALLWLGFQIWVRPAWGEGRSPETETQELARDIQMLQPRVSDERAYRLAAIIRDACAEHAIPPRLVVAMVMRESSYDLAVESLERRGQQGELGLLQVMPRGPALALRPDGCTEALEGAECQIATGVAWLALARDRCPGTQARWLAAYGLGRCPSEADAREVRGVRRLEHLLSTLGGGGEW